MSAFANLREAAFPYKYEGLLKVSMIMGGTPSDPAVAEGWLKAKMLQGGSDTALKDAAAKVMVERGISDPNEAIEALNELKHLNGFKRDPKHGLYVEGRQLKAAIKEAANVALAAGKLDIRGWGNTNKGLLSFAAEHIFVVQDRLYLGCTEPDGVEQRFVHTWRGTGIQYEEFVRDAQIHFTVITDVEFSETDWAAIWLTGENQGLGASRSQSFGRYTIEEWNQVGKPSTKSPWKPQAARKAARVAKEVVGE
jgi:hypothetical protein